MRLAWLTDIHLNFLRPEEAEDFFASVRADKPDEIMLTGDIGEAAQHCRVAGAARRCACSGRFILCWGIMIFTAARLPTCGGVVESQSRERPNLVISHHIGCD